MRKRSFGFSLPVTLLALLLSATAMTGAPVSAQDGASMSELTVSVSGSEVSTQTGNTFQFTSEITNNGSVVSPPLIANLDFVAIDQSTYVDPEDWSPERTLTVDPIPAGSSATQSWTVKPVLKGDVAAYVVILPNSAERAIAGPLAASAAIHIRVEEHRTLNPGGVLPVVIAVPGVLALLFAGLQIAGKRR
jgi:hypothetical protein